jgi:hypothetical protein
VDSSPLSRRPQRSTLPAALAPCPRTAAPGVTQCASVQDEIIPQSAATGLQHSMAGAVTIADSASAHAHAQLSQCFALASMPLQCTKVDPASVSRGMQLCHDWTNEDRRRAAKCWSAQLLQVPSVTLLQCSGVPSQSAHADSETWLMRCPPPTAKPMLKSTQALCCVDPTSYTHADSRYDCRGQLRGIG